MASSSNRALAAVVAAFCLAATNVVQQAEAHPNCLGDFAPDLSADAQFCPDTNVDGFCCNGPQEASIQANYDLAGATGACADLYEEVCTRARFSLSHVQFLVAFSWLVGAH